MPPAVVNPLTYEEHRELGREILRSKERLRHLCSVVAGVYGQNSRTSFTFQKMNEAMERLCVEMQTQAEADCPGLDASSFYR